MGYNLRSVMIYLGYEICPVCGSKDIIIRGFEGINQRYDCQTCGAITPINGDD